MEIRRSNSGKYHYGDANGNTACNYSGQQRRTYTRHASEREIAEAPESAVCKKCFPNGLPKPVNDDPAIDKTQLQEEAEKLEEQAKELGLDVQIHYWVSRGVARTSLPGFRSGAMLDVDVLVAELRHLIDQEQYAQTHGGMEKLRFGDCVRVTKGTMTGWLMLVKDVRPHEGFTAVTCMNIDGLEYQMMVEEDGLQREGRRIKP